MAKIIFSREGKNFEANISKNIKGEFLADSIENENGIWLVENVANDTGKKVTFIKSMMIDFINFQIVIGVKRQTFFSNDLTPATEAVDIQLLPFTNEILINGFLDTEEILTDDFREDVARRMINSILDSEEIDYLFHPATLEIMTEIEASIIIPAFKASLNS